MPKPQRGPAIQLVETRRGCAMFKTKSRYNVLFYGVVFDQLYWNMRGYLGYLPLPEGGRLTLPEGSLASYKREAARPNREFALLPNVMTASVTEVATARPSSR